ncbi:hypothetical protein ASE01_20125 [Nocardioides sp. Root190]|uniref:alpha/beta hydrolase family protein n=1 Tax=Nocardioides sp. Root190 TaxID=1736488 RepID=UPI000701D1A4|nr:alpha/beta hydrolase [Nocardioides sp. Root190]KRB73085.1 hypothetical protein ASE01_20125 [Nocardioides sp. Root190]
MNRLATAAVFGQGYSPTVPTESQYVAATVAGQRGERTLLVYCHGSGGSATGLLTTPLERAFVDALAQRNPVIAADLALQAWGSDRHVQAIGEAIAYAESLLITPFGPAGKIFIVAGSMGNLGGLGYVLAHPEKVRAYAGLIPALDLASLNTMPPIPSEIAVAYGAPYNDATMGPTHSPVRYAAALDPDVPIRLWTASNDTICLPSTATAFVAARPQTERVDLGPLGHTAAAVAAAQPSILSWLRTV